MILSTLHQVYPLKYYLQWHSTRHQNVHRTVTISSRIRRQSNIRKNYLTCLHFKKKISGDWVRMWRQSNSKEDTLFYCPHLQNFSLLLEKVVEIKVHGCGQSLTIFFQRLSLSESITQLNIVLSIRRTFVETSASSLIHRTKI